MTLSFPPKIMTMFFLIIASLVICAHIYVKETPKPGPQDSYERIGFVLAQKGVYSNDTKSENPGPDVGRAPIYPAFIAVFVKFDQQHRDYLKCIYVDRQGNKCIFNAQSIYIVQSMIFLAFTFSVFAIGRIVGAGRISSSVFALGGLFVAADMVTNFRMSEAIALPLFAILSFLIAKYFSGKYNAWLFVLLGISLGLLALTRVAYIYMLPLISLALLFIPLRENAPSLKDKIKFVALFCLMFSAVMTPWLYRSHTLSGQAVVGETGINGVLSMRVQYNKMELEDALVGMVYWIPDFGDNLARKLFPKEQWEKFDDSSPNSYRERGWERLRQFKKDDVSNEEVKDILISEIKSNVIRHALVSIPIAWRGLKYVWPFVPFFLGGIFILIYRREWWVLGLLLPTIFNLFFHAGFSHFHPRYGYPMIVGFAPIAAFFVSWLWLKMRSSKTHKSHAELSSN